MISVTRSVNPILRARQVLPALLCAALGCAVSSCAVSSCAVSSRAVSSRAVPAQAPPAAALPVALATSPAALSEAPGPAPSSAASTSSTPSTLPDTPAGHQLGAWLQAFNSGERAQLLAYHERLFPYAAASRDIGSIEREHRLSQGTGGFDVRRVEESEPGRLVALLQERNSPQHARVRLQVSPDSPHLVTRFNIGPVPTPRELLSPEQREARAMDASRRRAALDSIQKQLEAHYVYLETAQQVSAVLRKRLARGDYDQLTDAVEFADAVGRDLMRLARDRHLGLRFGPMPAPPKLDGQAPPRVERSGYGFGSSQRLRGNVALLVINGFPPLFDAQKAAIGERMSEVADADAVIVDLRSNNGGFPPTEQHVASYFFDEQPVLLKTIHRRDSGESFEVRTERELPGKRLGSSKPVFVLTGQRTFSGGEALAYELQALGRALVVGENTRGGAHASFPYPVEGGFVLRVPTMRGVNPVTGTNWEGVGIVPDVDVPEEEALETAHRLALERLGRE